MKKKILTLLLLMGNLATQAQDFFNIEGKVKNVKEGALLTLFHMEGDSGSRIGTDTIHNGHFQFKIPATELLEKFMLHGQNDDFPSMGLCLWARSGSHLRITGNNSLIYTWQVKSNVQEQQINQTFIKDSRLLWDQYQQNNLKINDFYSILHNTQVQEAKKIATRHQLDSVERLSEKIYEQIQAKTIKRMKKMPIDPIWLDELESLARSVHDREDYPYKEDVLAFYNRLSEKGLCSEKGKTIRTLLFPPPIANEGDDMADADLYDLDGKKHRLSDYKGKHLLLDFWSFGCGPCIMAFPEMREIAEQYKERLVVISLSTDTRKAWERTSKEHNITWKNLNDLEGTNGLYARYGANGTPYYVLISPEGKIVEKWSGYGKHYLKLKLRRPLHSNNPMSIGQENNHTVVNFPKVKKTTTAIHEIRQIVLTDTATILRIHGYYIPKYWIQLAKTIQLIADNGTCCPIQRSEGIPLGERFFMPENGEADYTLYFAPLPKGTRSFDLIEQNVSNPDRMEGIALTL